MAVSSDLLLLPVRSSLRSRGDDAAAFGGVPVERAGRGLSRGSLLLRIFTLQPDRWQPRWTGWGRKTVVPIGALMAGAGALLFATGNLAAANVGRFLQGAGGVFALVGAVYIATKNFPASRAATLIGATQMFGMAGGSAGQFLVGPLIGAGACYGTASGSQWERRAGIGALLFMLLPRLPQKNAGDNWIASAAAAMAVVFKNPQSILCGLIAGLLFIPTTIFDMIWGVRYLQEAHGFDYGSAVIRSATVPLGWIIGCPLLGFISDRIGRRKPVIVGGGLLLFGMPRMDSLWPRRCLPSLFVGLVAGIASGAAMMPYTVIKEANPPQYSGTATGVINFLNFTFSALLGPVFGWMFQTLIRRLESRTGALPGDF